jgi:hypothetical protein
MEQRLAPLGRPTLLPVGNQVICLIPPVLHHLALYCLTYRAGHAQALVTHPKSRDKTCCRTNSCAIWRLAGCSSCAQVHTTICQNISYMYGCCTCHDAYTHPSFPPSHTPTCPPSTPFPKPLPAFHSRIDGLCHHRALRHPMDVLGHLWWHQVPLKIPAFKAHLLQYGLTAHPLKPKAISRKQEGVRGCGGLQMVLHLPVLGRLCRETKTTI